MSVDLARQTPRRLERVELAHQPGHLAYQRRLGGEVAQQLVEQPLAFALELVDGALQGVVLFDDLERLEVETLAGRRTPVHEAGELAAVPGLHHEHQAAAAHRNRLLADELAVRAADRLEAAVEPLAGALDLSAKRGEPRAGVVAHLTLAIENAADLRHQRTRVGEIRHGARQLDAGRVGP